MWFEPQTSSSDTNTPPFRARLAATFAFAILLAPGTAPAQDDLPVGSTAGGEPPSFSIETPIGALEYRAGRGMRFGDTGLTVGGFTLVEYDDEEHDDGVLEFDSLNFLILYEPIDRLRFFAELEIGGLARYEPVTDDFDHDPDAVIERLYADWSQSDALNLRVGKFQTPIGRWNLVSAEPFVWTAVEPVQIERGFDEHQTGAALFGTFYPAGIPLRYWLYGQFVDPLDADEDAVARSAGGRLEWGGTLGNWSVGTSVLTTKDKGEWTYAGGLDGLLRLGPFELSSEAIFSEGGIPGRDLWSVYVQSVYDMGFHLPPLRGFYLVTRYEHFDPDGRFEKDADLWDLGLTWIPVPWANVKAGYRLSDEVTESVATGIRASLSVLF